MADLFFPAPESGHGDGFDTQYGLDHVLLIGCFVFTDKKIHQLQALFHASYVKGGRGSPVVDQSFLQDPDVCVRAGFQHTEKEIPVFKAGAHRLIIASALFPDFPAEYVSGRTAVPGKKGGNAASLRTDDGVKNTEGMEPGRSSSHRRILSQQTADFFNIGRLQPVISIQYQHHRTLSLADTGVSGGRYPAVGLTEDLYRNGPISVRFNLFQYTNGIFIC